ncbi:MAG: hypothetical protein IJG23_01575, partial [Clostridia bacterium]|nr:hypothetical protein [Clostridia bacterium]
MFRKEARNNTSGVEKRQTNNDYQLNRANLNLRPPGKSGLITLIQPEKTHCRSNVFFSGSGSRTRTCDLRVM